MDGYAIVQIRGRSASGNFEELARFEGETGDNQWLTFTLDEPAQGIQIVRVEILRSPSWVAWREVQIFGEQ